MLRKIVRGTGATIDVVIVNEVSIVEGTVPGGTDVEVNNAGVVTDTGVTVARSTAANGVVATVSVARMSVAIKSVAMGLHTKIGVAGVA